MTTTDSGLRDHFTCGSGPPKRTPHQFPFSCLAPPWAFPWNRLVTAYAWVNVVTNNDICFPYGVGEEEEEKSRHRFSAYRAMVSKSRAIFTVFVYDVCCFGSKHECFDRPSSNVLLRFNFSEGVLKWRLAKFAAPWNREEIVWPAAHRRETGEPRGFGQTTGTGGKRERGTKQLSFHSPIQPVGGTWIIKCTILKWFSHFINCRCRSHDL
jgi:hypothetical protein